MFNKKKTVFLGIVSMLFVLVFVSGCKKAEVYDLALTNNEELVEDINEPEEESVEENKEEVTKEILEKTDNLEEVSIIFENLSWKKHSNKLLAYSLDYPTIVNVVGNDLDQHVEFTGPLSNNEWWPRISVSHYSNSFYRPGDDVTVAELVKPFPDYKLGEEMSIAGFETIHYKQAKTSHAWAADYFYFIKDNQLYNITIIHSNDKQDWDLYNKMLESFIFNDDLSIE